mgnify:FL=1
MINVQSFIKDDSIIIFFDNEGIDEMISYLNFIKNNDTSFHLNGGNELDENPFDEKMFVIPHIKIINPDKLDPI